MKTTVPQPRKLPAHYLDNRQQLETDTKTKEMLRDANADVLFNHHNSGRATMDQDFTEKELQRHYDQLEALDKPAADNLTVDQKKTLRNYYKGQIRQLSERLNVFIHGNALTERARNCNVEFEVVA